MSYFVFEPTKAQKHEGTQSNLCDTLCPGVLAVQSSGDYFYHQFYAHESY